MSRVVMGRATDYADAVRTVIAARRSIRKFAGGEVPTEALRMLVEAGVAAPSGSNSQNQRFLVINDAAEIDRIGRQRWVLPYGSGVPAAERRKRRPEGIVGRAGAVIVVFADSALTAPVDTGEYYIWEALDAQNCAASIQNMLLLATAMGLASCWISASDSMSYTRLCSGQSWRKILAGYAIPVTYKIQGIVLLGQPTRVDDRGLPIAFEGTHGILEEPVERGPIEEYLIDRSTSADNGLESARAGWVTRRQIAFYARLIHVMLRTLRRVDLGIRRLERQGRAEDERAAAADHQ